MSYSQTLTLTCETKVATKYAQVLLGCFRRGEAEDGPTYVRAVVAILTGYPESVVHDVCDPRRGLPVKSQFLPTLFEVKAACDARIAPLLAEEGRRRRLAEAEADKRKPISEAEGERRRAFVAEWRLLQEARSGNGHADSARSELDARCCKGEMRKIVKREIEKHLAELGAEYRATPCAPIGSLARTGSMPPETECA